MNLSRERGGRPEGRVQGGAERDVAREGCGAGGAGRTGCGAGRNVAQGGVWAPGGGAAPTAPHRAAADVRIVMGKWLLGM